MEDVVQTIFIGCFVVAFFVRKKSVFSSFQREIPCSRPLTLFFYLILLKKTLLLTKGQWISMEDVAQIIFFFLKKKPYLQLNLKGNSLLQTWTKLNTSCLDCTFHFIFVSSACTSFERSRLHRVLLNRGSADRGTSGNSVKMQICSRCALGEMYLYGNEHSRSHSLKCLV